jgi:hypothetical protein
MTKNDGRDREVREYVRNRMAADLPPEFTRDVMNDVHRTTQRRRGIFAWPILAPLVTVAATVAVVVIGLGLLNQPDGLGSEPTPSATSSPSTSPSSTPGASATEEPTGSPTASPTTGEGEFGPIHSMDPEEAFPNGQTCEVTDAIVNTEPTDLNWSISYPEGWFTNEESTPGRSSCTLFGPEPFEFSDQGVPESVAITVDIPPGGDFSTGGTATSTEYTVEGVPAVRYEITPVDGGFVTAPTVLWIVGIGGNLPAVGNDQPYLAFQTYSDDPEQLRTWTEVLDRMVATLDIGE